MSAIDEKVNAFLAGERIAVAGVSRGGQSPANSIYVRLKQAGHTVFAVNPNMETFDGQLCYPDIPSIPGGVDGVVVVTRPETTLELVRQCQQAGVRHVWMHRSLGFIGGGSVSEEAVAFCKEQGIEVIAGACPMMFCEPVDFGHKCMRWMMRLAGSIPG